MGVRPLIFLSGSMSPAIPAGSLGLARTTDADDLEVGDIVTVPTNGTFVTHRIVEITHAPGKATLLLRGDGNRVADATAYEVAVGTPHLLLRAGGRDGGRLVLARPGRLRAGGLGRAGPRLAPPASRRGRRPAAASRASGRAPEARPGPGKAARPPCLGWGGDRTATHRRARPAGRRARAPQDAARAGRGCDPGAPAHRARRARRARPARRGVHHHVQARAHLRPPRPAPPGGQGGSADVRHLRRHDHAGRPDPGRGRGPGDDRRARRRRPAQRVRPPGGLVRGGPRRRGARRAVPCDVHPRPVGRGGRASRSTWSPPSPPGPATGRIVAVRQDHLLATSFHPEVTGDARIHALFADLVREAAG